MVHLRVGTEQTKATGDDPRPELGRDVVQDHEVDIGATESASDGADKMQTFLEPLAVRSENAPIQQNGHVYVALAVGASLRIAPEEIRGHYPLR